jgi:hypothetical protein
MRRRVTLGACKLPSSAASQKNIWEMTMHYVWEVEDALNAIYMSVRG